MTVAMPYSTLKDVSTQVRDTFNKKAARILVDDFKEQLILCIPNDEFVVDVIKK